MRKRSVLSRIVLYGVAIVQMAAPAMAAVVDARLITDSGGAPQVHVEDHTQKSCRPVHPDDCALCQLLTHFSAPRASAPVVPSGTTTSCGASSDEARRPASIARAHERSRAPPVSLS